MNNELREILKFHCGKYPLMQVRDAVKLIYQNEFGGGHFIADESASLAYLKEEISKIKTDETPIVNIGNGTARINITTLPHVTLNRLFVVSANKCHGDIESFKSKLNLIYELPFDKDEIDNYLKQYSAAGYPAVSHSEIYRNAYNPAYRIIDEKYIALLDLFAAIDRKSLAPIVIGIDGKCGSGKSTIAELLREVYQCDVIHMDDFFLPPDLRTEERRNEIGGNVHYERFAEEVMSKIKSHEPFEYRVFDCSIMDYNGTKVVHPKDLIIVEGSYSSRFRFDLNIFIDVSDEIQKQRIVARDGEFMWDKFENIWIPMENAYFDEFNIREKSDKII